MSKKIKVVALIVVICILVLDMMHQMYDRGSDIINAQWKNDQTKITITEGNLDKGAPIDEDAIADERYRETPQEAIEAVQTLAPPEEIYRWHVDEVIFQKESDEYMVLYYRAILNKNVECFTFIKLKKKQIDGAVKYTALFWESFEHTNKKQLVDIDLYGFNGYVQSNLHLADMERDMSVEPGVKRFVWSATTYDDIYKLKIEGQAPTEIIPYMEFDQQFYFWYYDDIQSDKPFSQMEFTVE